MSYLRLGTLATAMIQYEPGIALTVSIIFTAFTGPASKQA